MTNWRNNTKDKEYAFIICMVVEAMLFVFALFVTWQQSSKATIISPPIGFWQSRFALFSDETWSGNQDNMPEECDFIYGPFVYAEKGTYSVSVDYLCDVDQSMDVYSYQRGECIKQFEKEVLPADETSATYHFVVTDDVEDLEVRIHYNGNGNIEVGNITVAQSSFFVKLLLIIMLFLFAVIDMIWILRVYQNSSANRENLNDGNIKFLPYRNVWMGIAILWVMIYHSDLVFADSVLDFIKRSGYGGVDIFFFASGIGCYFSYLKDHNAMTFIKRRFVKIMPTYYAFLIPWMTYKVLVDDMPYQSVIGNILCVEGFRDMTYSFNWYMTALWAFYLLIPFFATIVEKKINSGYSVVIMTILAVIASSFSWDYYEWVIIFTRIPVLMLGLYFAKQIKNKELKFDKFFTALLLILNFGGVVMLVFCNKYFPEKLWDKGLYWYPFILIVPGLCMIISYVFSKIETIKYLKPIVMVIEKLGSITFEVYLVHIVLFRLIHKWISEDKFQESNLLWIVAMGVSICGAVLLRYLVDFGKKIVRKVRE